MHNLFLLKTNLNIETKGNALVETIFFMPVIIVFILAISWHAKILIMRQQLVIASRYATDLILQGCKNEQFIKKEIKDFLGQKNLKINIKISEKVPSPAFSPPSSYVEIYCPVDVSPLAGKKIYVSARSEVYNDTYIIDFFKIPDEEQKN